MKAKIRGLRWYIVALLCFASGLNYLDRQTLSILAQTIQDELNLTTVQYSYITSAFLLSYTIMYAVNGRLIDWLGTRRSLLLFVSGWSIANVLHAFATTTLQFSFFRFLLGATESGHFPAGVKAVTEWFPMRERALAIGLFNSGTAVGAAIAAPVVSWIALTWGWRDAFVAGGVLGGVWVVVWARCYRLPRDHPRLSEEESQLIEADERHEEPKERVSVKRLLRERAVWGCILARVLTDPISYFFIFWTPKFLQQERGFNLADLGRYSWIPFVVAALGNIAGGVIPQRLTSAGWSLDRARKSVMLAASCIVPLCCFAVVRVPTPAWAVVMISVAMFCHGAWANMTLPAELFPRHVVATVSGFGGASGAFIGALVTPLIGWTVQNISFTPVFGVIAFLPLIAFLCVCGLVKKIGIRREIPI